MSLRRAFGITGGGAVLVLVGFVGYRHLDTVGIAPRPLAAGSSATQSPQVRPEVAVQSSAENSGAADLVAFDSVLPERPDLSDEKLRDGSLDPTRANAEVTDSQTGSEGTAPSGRLLVPVAGVLPEQLVDTYFQARSEGRRHDAIDIVAPRGTPVVAVAPGTVFKLFQSQQGGITLYELAVDQRTIYYYAHLDSYAAGLVEGGRLRRGETIGYVGDTGNAGAGNYHLHFEISTTEDPSKYWGGTPVNPYPLLRGTVAPPP